jgi:hypothetical protein
MAKAIEITSVVVNGEDKKGNPVFEATGTLNEVEFVARTIQYKGDPIFKLQEAGAHQRMADSQFTRGDRIAVARACKAARLEAFGDGSKPRVEPELAEGETVLLAASVEVDADDTSTEELEAARDILKKIAELDAEAEGAVA